MSKPCWSLNWNFFFIIIFWCFFFFLIEFFCLFVLNAVLSLLFCYYRMPVSSGLCTHWFIIVGLPLNTGVLVLIFLKINNKRALKHALFQEKSNLGELHGLSTQKWGRERKGKIRSTLSFTNLDTVSSLKWGQNSKMAGFTAAAVWIFFFSFWKKAFLNFKLQSEFLELLGTHQQMLKSGCCTK